MKDERNHIDCTENKFFKKLFGTLPNGTDVYTYTICNNKGVELSVMNYGATITALHLENKNIKLDIVLGFDTLEGYLISAELPAPPYFGAVIGRYSGRIKNGVFDLNGKQIQLHKNTANNTHTLHGGINGFDKVFWHVKHVDDASITLFYTSPDGEEEFPGELQVEVTYTLTQKNEIVIQYKAVSSEDTIINLTNHSYFNLNGHKSDLFGQELFVNSDSILEIDEYNIPSGVFTKASTEGFDLMYGNRCPEKIDDSFVIQDHSIAAAILKSKVTGLQLSVFSDQPSVHIYVGGNCFGLNGKNGADYHHYSGICFESQNYPDAPNHDHFPNAVLKKGEIYHQKTTWEFNSYSE